MTLKGSDQEPTSQPAREPIPTSGFDLSSLPVREALTAWHEGFGALTDSKLLNPVEDRLPISAKAFHIDDLVLCSLATVAQRVNRSRARIARDGIDVYTLNFFEKGDGFSGHEACATRTGDLAVLDMSQSHTLGMTDNRSLDLIVPRRLLAPLLKSPDEQNMRAVRGNTPLVALFYNHLRTLYEQAPSMTLAQARAIIRPTVELAAAVLNGGVSEENAAAVNGALTAQIRQYINHHLLEPNLSAETIAGAFGMSVRKLYYLFEPDGGVMAYIQKKRLYLVYTAITDPAQSHRTIHDIAESHSFKHRKNFNAAFRRAFDVTPREARAFALEGRSGETAARRNGSTMWDWIRHLR